MSRTKLISLRIDEQTLVEIDNIAKIRGYTNRSWVINHLLKAVLQCTVNGQVWKLIHSYDPFSDGYTIHITKREGKPIY